MAVTLEQARAAKQSAKALLASVPGVVGLGITKIGKDYALLVNLDAELPPERPLPNMSTVFRYA